MKTRVCLLTLALCLAHADARAQQQPGMPGSLGFAGGIVASNVPPKIQDVTFSQRLGERLPLDARLKDESGRDVTLGDYFGRKPVVLAFVYYQCPMLCPLVMNGISSALKVVPFTPGQEFDVVLISFDHRDTPEAANAKKRAHLVHWSVPETADGWHFLTGTEEQTFVTIDGTRLKFTNLNKIFFPEDGYTKRDLINYYDLWEKHSIMADGLVELIVNCMTDVKPGFIEWEMH